ncbi:MAG: anthranilate synthase component I [Actinomycetes bacterium]
MIVDRESIAQAVTPSREDAIALTAQHSVVPVLHTVVEDCETPVSAYLKLRGRGPSFLLESAERGQSVGRWSFIGFNPRSVLRWSLGDEGNPYDLAEQAAGGGSVAEVEGMPPFAGGAVGMFGYDLVRTVEPLGEPNPDPVGLPDLALMLTDAMVVFDHLRNRLAVFALIHSDAGDPGVQWDRAVDTIVDARMRLASPLQPSEREAFVQPEFESNTGPDRFKEMVSEAIEYIRAGDAFQVVPSQRWTAETGLPAFAIYRGLRAVNPSPYMYFLDFGDFEVAGASPEPLLTVHGRQVMTKPIAGTRPRGEDAEGDRRLAEELLADEKELAEHTMLVDLGRNDLGRVCEYGSVEVEELMAVENYSHVMHITSSVTGTLREGVSPIDALRSILPAGTLSGAPKVRAMQIIDELEMVKRGGYGGAIGYLSYSGDLDVCIHIRTVVVKDGKAHIQAGGGTVADALPATELAESEAKARAVMRAVELAATRIDWV